MPRARTRTRMVALAAAGVLALAALAVAVLSTLWASLPDPSPLSRQSPRTTALIEQRRAEARAARRRFEPRQSWVGLDRISPELVHAVVLAEDANFFGHEGFDWNAIRKAAEADLRAGRFARGASTITQQLAKNLYLGTEKSLVRKAKEAVLAAKLERSLSKRRILALYLNVAEWGDGVFGVEAGARRRFGVPAADLTPAQAAVLASMLPAPRRVDLSHPSTWLRRGARRLLDRMRDVGRLTDDQHRHASAELERILAGPRPADDRAEEPPEDDDLPAGPEPEAEGPASEAIPGPIPAPVPVSTPSATIPAHPESLDSGAASGADARDRLPGREAAAESRETPSAAPAPSTHGRGAAPGGL